MTRTEMIETLERAFLKLVPDEMSRADIGQDISEVLQALKAEEAHEENAYTHGRVRDDGYFEFFKKNGERVIMPPASKRQLMDEK